MIELVAGDYRLELEPDRGGSVARFTWRGHDLFRPSRPGSMLHTACFPLVPFSNRIAQGKFRFGSNDVTLAPNMPEADHPHPLHGFGWLDKWTVLRADACEVTIEHRFPGGEWPWSYRARQRFLVSQDGLAIELSCENTSHDAMPAGLGLHPYFPRDADTVYHGLHRGEWCTNADCLPTGLVERAQAADWWDGQPVSSRNVDTAYSGRSGALSIAWPSRGLTLTMNPCDRLATTVVYSPADEDYFCVEPVSHATNSHNAEPALGDLTIVAPGAQLSAYCTFSAHRLSKIGDYVL